jgi:hypothetical protein
MPHYKDLNGNLHFLDSYEFSYLLPVGCVEISEEEVKPKVIDTPIISKPVFNFQEWATNAINAINERLGIT